MANFFLKILQKYEIFLFLDLRSLNHRTQRSSFPKLYFSAEVWKNGASFQLRNYRA